MASRVIPVRVSIAEAVVRLRRGELVALPTETVYGLGANALDPVAVARIFAAKGRPTHHPLIVHVASADHLPGWAEVPPLAWVLAERFWPGPLTMILPRGPLALDVVTGGLATVGLRVPSHPMMLEVLRELGGGVAAPSANRFGRISPTTADHVAAELEGQGVDAIVDGGACAVGIESTIIDLTGAPTVLRLGAITPDAIAAVIGLPVALQTEATRTAHGERAQAPGQLASHYAPNARLEIVPRAALANRAPAAGEIILGDAQLGASAESWAKNLYRVLREIDALGPARIVVPTPPPGALAAALADRLGRAAAPRGA